MNHPAKIIDGKAHAHAFLESMAKEVDYLKNTYDLTPRLVVVLVGDDPASIIYVRNKAMNAKAIDMDSDVIHLPPSISQEDLIDILEELNNDDETHGIIVQMPLPDHIDKFAILSAIDPDKDVDGFHPINVGLLHSGNTEGFIPCTPLGCMYLIKEYVKHTAGLHAVIIGRSQIVGRPLAALLLRTNCTVTICHSHTDDLDKITREADIVVSAMGNPQSLGAEYFKEGAVVIDVGITRVEQEDKARLMGDVRFNEVVNKVGYITPVPGGVGPMTVAFLIANTIKAAKRLHGVNA